MNPEQYEAAIKTLYELSSRTANRTGTWHQREACTILVKISLSALSTTFFMPGSKRFNNFVWDISTLAMISRSIIEAYCALLYIAVESTSENERHFRKLLWQYHRVCEQFRMAEATIPGHEGIKSVICERDELSNSIRLHPIFIGLSDKQQKRIIEGNDKWTTDAITIANNAGINKGLYRGIYKYFSSFAHPSPLGLLALYNHRAETQDTIELFNFMSMMNYGFLVFTIRDFTKVFPDQALVLSNDISQEISKWEEIFTWDFSRLEVQSKCQI